MADPPSPPNSIHAIISYADTYVQPLLDTALSSLPLTPLPASTAESSLPTTPLLIWTQYELLPFTHATSHPSSVLINSYIYRKALIRKHYLATTVRNWVIKNPSSSLQQHVQSSVEFELDYAEFLDDAFMEADGEELVASLGGNEGREKGEREWWILKAGMAERGGGIRLFSTMGELEGIFEGWDPESDDEGEVEVEGDRDGEVKVRGEKDEGIVTSQMRHFVAQRYVGRPLLFGEGFESRGRKFHVRTYVVAVGALKVFVYRRMLALFAGREYSEPGKEDDPNEELNGHLTNTCLQTGEREGSVHEFWLLPDHAGDLGKGWKEKAFEQICSTTGELFEAAAKGMMIHFQPLPNAFEIYGLDYLIDDSGNAWLLEVNAFPDFAQTGGDLKNLIAGLFDGVVEVAVKPFFGLQAEDGRASGDLVEVLNIDLGRR
ncbi:tubulin-tyrosine ligase family-domain-containing protein [Elsinoe ampelina]|uniref:Tubulin-tyrosine ligase family-domain-containing protein n=1 Tax=Elsinoe ampelina TaxID=302913 RepID=A0A6A6GKT3_9PEZI|nr:tubulin-tyrosine ligase family-domain-containing protein [Elsinoe ampelina]